jgi:hypothetical protein
MEERTADLPYVDGRATSAEALREAVARESDPLRRDVDEVRASVADTTGELVRRLDVRVSTARFRAQLVLFAAAALLAFVAVRRSRHSGAAPRRR